MKIEKKVIVWVFKDFYIILEKKGYVLFSLFLDFRNKFF